MPQLAPSIPVPRFFISVAMVVLAVSLPGPWVSAAETDEEIEAQRQTEYDALSRNQSQLEAHSATLKQVVRLVRPAVVHIEVVNQGEARPSTLRRGAADETGSGVIVRIDGKPFILTNRHLIRYTTPENIVVRFEDGRELRPTRMWQDPGTDIAVLALAGTGLKAARVGNSDKMEIGDFVLAIGSPFGLSHSVTHGILSAKGRRDLELATDGVSYQDFLQTDASINPGNSGGPLVNLRGEVVGINTAIASSSGHNEGIGFSIPSNMVMIVAKQLIERGTVIRGFLGVSLDSKFTSAAATQLGLDRRRGARVTAVTPGSPAAIAGFRVGDVVLEFNGVAIDDDNHLVNTVSLTDVGQAVPVSVFRDREVSQLSVKIAQRDAR